MNINKLFLSTLFFIILYSCADYNTYKQTDRKYYSSKGFALIYEDKYYEEKIVSQKLNYQNLYVIHDSLKKNTFINIVNPINSKTVEAIVYKKAKYPKIFNIVISDEISNILELDKNNPYVEVFELKKNKTFIAKEGQMFEEEKNVAEKAPVDEIKMDDLSSDSTKRVEKIIKKNNFTIVIGDFYYQKSAENLRDELLKQIKTNKFFIRKIGNNSYRLGIGPFKNFKALKLTYISLNNLGFENLNIYRD